MARPYNYTASLCYLLDDCGSRTLESLLILILRNQRIRLWVMFSVIVDADGHERGPTSHHVIRTEIQRDVTLRCGYIILAIVWVVTVSLPLKDQRYQTSSKADNQTSNLPCIGFYLFRRLHVPFLPKLLNDYIYLFDKKRKES